MHSAIYRLRAAAIALQLCLRNKGEKAAKRMLNKIPLHGA